MKATGTRRHPDFLGDAMAIDDDLATVVELDFQNAIGGRFNVQSSGLDGRLDTVQRDARGPVEFDFRHDVPC